MSWFYSAFWLVAIFAILQLFWHEMLLPSLRILKRKTSELDELDYDQSS